jgi:hypothetical protein
MSLWATFLGIEDLGDPIRGRLLLVTMDPFFVAATLGSPEHGPGSLNLGGLRLPLQCERRQRKNLRERSNCVDDQFKDRINY